jgi:hypothetical protein
MGVQELLLGYLQELPTSVKRVLLETLVAEQSQLDLERPRGVKDHIKEAIEREAKTEVGGRAK